jgi:hypothetical protein
MIWFGDSSSEHFLGTDTGVPSSEKSTVPVWQKHYASKYRAACFAMAHDRTVSVLWQVLNGEAPKARNTYLGASCVARQIRRLRLACTLAQSACLQNIRMTIEFLGVGCGRRRHFR